MRIAQYTRAERAISAADSNTIRERWLYGLRLLNDPEKMTPSGKSLRHGVVDRLIADAVTRGLKLSEREVQWRLKCARTYPTEAQIRNAVTDLGAWRDLVAAGFPPCERPADEPDADWRTEAERRHLRAQALAEMVGDQGTLFPLDEFEPTESTLKDLHAYADDQADFTARFVERDRKRAEYLAALDAAVNEDLSVTWQDAHRLAFAEDLS